jgi:phosphatidylglycerophosphatase A
MNTTRKNDIVVFLATGCFTGFLPLMPGTWGTFAAIPIVILVHRVDLVVQGIIALVFVAFGAWISGRAEILLEEHDPRPIVIDEMAGFLISLLWLPLNPITLFLGFGLFRLFDVVKPPPISSVEKRMRGGWGVVIDDVLAGVFTNATLRLLFMVAGLL